MWWKLPTVKPCTPTPSTPTPRLCCPPFPFRTHGQSPAGKSIPPLRAKSRAPSTHRADVLSIPAASTPPTFAERWHRNCGIPRQAMPWPVTCSNRKLRHNPSPGLLPWRNPSPEYNEACSGTAPNDKVRLMHPMKTTRTHLMAAAIATALPLGALAEAPPDDAGGMLNVATLYYTLDAVTWDTTMWNWKANHDMLYMDQLIMG